MKSGIFRHLRRSAGLAATSRPPVRLRPRVETLEGRVALADGSAFHAADLIIQGSDRPVYAGDVQQSGSADHDFGVERYIVFDTSQAPGRRLDPDPSFGTDGGVTINFDIGGALDDRAQKIILLSGGKFLVAGFAQVDETSYALALARLNGDGTLDTTFDGDGRQVLTFDGGLTGVDVFDLSVVAGGKVLVAARARLASGLRGIALARLNADGSPDASFSGDGRTAVDFAVGERRLRPQRGPHGRREAALRRIQRGPDDRRGTSPSCG